MSDPQDLTRLLNEIGASDPESAAALTALIYEELRQMAARQMARENPGGTLQSTALVHEVYLRLFRNDNHNLQWASRAQFFRFAAECMQRLLIELARKRGRRKRGGDRRRLSLDAIDIAAVAHDDDLASEIMALHDALERLKERDPRMHEVVLLRFHAGLSVEETAKLLGVSARTVKRDWMVARAWLHAAMREEPE